MKESLKQNAEETTVRQRNIVINLSDDDCHKLAIKDGEVYRNGTLLSEVYLDESILPNGTEGNIDEIVKEGHIFVMGDNREGSKDSRHPEIGLVDKREVLGKVFFLFLPGTNEGEEPQDFGRIGVID